MKMGHIFCKSLPKQNEICHKTLRLMRSPVILIIGKPHSGKGILIRRLVVRYHFYHIDFISLINEEVAVRSTFGRIMEDSVCANGSLVPRIVLFELIKKIMIKKIYECAGFIFEGFPRDLQQAIDFEDYLVEFTKVIYIHLDEKNGKNRAFIDLPGGGMPNIQADCRFIRLIKFDRRTIPLIKYYRTKEKLIRLEGINNPDFLTTQVFDEIDELLDQLGIPVKSRLT